MKKIGILTAGGDAPGLNAAIRSIVLAANPFNISVIGFHNGFDGLIHSEFQHLDFNSVNAIINKGGTILESSRGADFKNKSFRDQAFQNIVKEQLDGLIIMGGNGTAKAASIFFEENNFPILLIPKTIDRDIPLANHTIGFDTAANTAMEAIDKIRDTANSHHRLFFIEVMGRDCGHLAIEAGISAGADIIMIPEIELKENDLIKLINKSYKNRKDSLIVVVAEGALKNPLEEFVEKVSKEIHQFDIRISKLGYIQRGGAPSAFDRFLASRLGFEAVNAIRNGHKGQMLNLIGSGFEFIELGKLKNLKKTIDPQLLQFIQFYNESN